MRLESCVSIRIETLEPDRQEFSLTGYTYLSDQTLGHAIMWNQMRWPYVSYLF